MESNLAAATILRATGPVDVEFSFPDAVATRRALRSRIRTNQIHASAYEVILRFTRALERARRPRILTATIASVVLTIKTEEALTIGFTLDSLARHRGVPPRSVEPVARVGAALLTAARTALGMKQPSPEVLS